MLTSSNLLEWTEAGMALDGLPAWAADAIPGARGAWAPDISFYNGLYHLYYSVSTFGRNNSAIGLAVNRRFRTKEGDSKEETTFVDCEAWGRTAEVMHQYLSKGKPVFKLVKELVDGELMIIPGRKAMAAESVPTWSPLLPSVKPITEPSAGS